jgi:hypothetical protein
MSRIQPIKHSSLPAASASEWVGTATMVVLGMAAVARGAAHLVWWANSKIKGES